MNCPRSSSSSSSSSLLAQVIYFTLLTALLNSSCSVCSEGRMMRSSGTYFYPVLPRFLWPKSLQGSSASAGQSTVASSEEKSYKGEVVRTNNCTRVNTLMTRRGETSEDERRSIHNEWACFPVEACEQWHSPLNTRDPVASISSSQWWSSSPWSVASNQVWPVCQWRRQERLTQVHTKDKWIPVSVCCPKPVLQRKESTVRALAKFLYDLPIKKIHVTTARAAVAVASKNKRLGHFQDHECGRVQVNKKTRDTAARSSGSENGHSWYAAATAAVSMVTQTVISVSEMSHLRQFIC